MISAPSNIALIKYMGKLDSKNNVPTNSSLSYTLEHLRTFIELRPLNPEKSNPGGDCWQPLVGNKLEKMVLSERGIEKFLKHFLFLKNYFKIDDQFIVSSANNFPSDCGLASSASSFAALTRATCILSESQSIENLPGLSRRGSGSSCRSFFSPWGLWSVEGGKEVYRSVDIPYRQFLHMVVIVDDQKKLVSSSEAHVRVLSSPNFEGRPERAERRLEDLVKAFTNHDWYMAFRIAWDEFIDMHELFYSSNPSFGYITEGSKKVLQYLQKYWQEHKDGPIVTMDAGANVHLLFRDNDVENFLAFRKLFSQEYRVLASTDFQIDPNWMQYGT